MKYLIEQIHDHPVTGGITGSIIAFLFSSINIPETTQALELAGAIIKDIGILAGTTIAVASLCSYASKNWFKKSKNGTKS